MDDFKQSVRGSSRGFIADFPIQVNERTVAAGIRAGRGAGLPSPAEKNARKTEP